jgi:hypothetical protein
MCPQLATFKPVVECPMRRPPDPDMGNEENDKDSFDPKAVILNPYVCEIKR